jgi:hypothetical protein
MKFQLILVTKMSADGIDTAASSEVQIVISADVISGSPNTPQGAIDVILEELSEIPGFSIS